MFNEPNKIYTSIQSDFLPQDITPPNKNQIVKMETIKYVKKILFQENSLKIYSNSWEPLKEKLNITIYYIKKSWNI